MARKGCMFVLDKVVSTLALLPRTLTQLAAAVPKVLGIEVAAVNTQGVGVDAGHETFVVVDKVLGLGVGQFYCLGFTERTQLGTPFWGKKKRSKVSGG